MIYWALKGISSCTVVQTYSVSKCVLSPVWLNEFMQAQTCISVTHIAA